MRIGEIIRQYRWATKTGVRVRAREIGVSPATLSRIERGEQMDGATLILILAWMFEKL